MGRRRIQLMVLKNMKEGENGWEINVGKKWALGNRGLDGCEQLIYRYIYKL